MGETINSCKTIAIRYRFVYEPLGPTDHQQVLQFLPHTVRKLEIETPINVDVQSEDNNNGKLDNVIYEDDVEYLRSLDPKLWKNQDHYKVLGIEKLRYQASDDIIKTAYRKKVLKHHPDKRKALGEEIKPDDDYFTCITMAYETLGNVARRRAYDSVDPYFDNSLPSQNEIKENFYEVFNYYFELNSRWSESNNVPKLGGPDASRENVENFYSFWYNFKSWREYSYEDEEDKDKCQDRDERRYVDKLNKAERIRKKKEEMLRVRQLVDLSYNNDPRIAKFKQDDKEKKLAMKRARQSAAQAKREEEERLLKEAQLAKEQAEAAERAKIEAKRQEREAQKRALKKSKKQLRDICKKHNYYADSNDERLTHMTSLETICEIFNLNDLEQLNTNLINYGKAAFLSSIKDVQQRIEDERQALLDATKTKTEIKNDNKPNTAEWNEDNIQLLVKAVNLFPAGTNQRWEVVANFINQHGTFKDTSSTFNAKSVLAKAKDLQNTDFTKNNLKDVANKQAFDNFKKDKKNVLNVDESGISKKEVNGINKTNNVTINGTHGITTTTATTPTTITTSCTTTNGGENNVNNNSKPWTTTEQQLLEQALKTYPSSVPERWDKIAECIPNRSKKECMKRYKELVETVKAKKAAQAGLNSIAK